MREIEIEYRDYLLICKFEVEPGCEGDHWTPGQDARIVGLRIYLNDTDISDLLEKKQIDQIYQIVYDYLISENE